MRWPRNGQKPDLCPNFVCGGDGEQQPSQCGGTSFISAHFVFSHSSLTPLTDELQRLAELPADSALAHSPSAPSPLPPPSLPCSSTIPSTAYPGGCKSHGGAERTCTQRQEALERQSRENKQAFEWQAVCLKRAVEPL